MKPENLSLIVAELRMTQQAASTASTDDARLMLSGVVFALTNGGERG